MVAFRRRLVRAVLGSWCEAGDAMTAPIPRWGSSTARRMATPVAIEIREGCLVQGWRNVSMCRALYRGPHVEWAAAASLLSLVACSIDLSLVVLEGDDAWEAGAKVKELKVPGEAILVGKFGPMPRTAKLHRLSIAIAEPLHSEIASTSPVCDCAKGIEMHKRPSIGARRSC